MKNKKNLKSPKDFAIACENMQPHEIYHLFEIEINQSLRNKIYEIADPDCSEPFRDACIKLGEEFKIESLINY